MRKLIELIELYSSKLSIKKKLWLSFSAIFFILALVASNAIWTLFSNRSSLTYVMDDLQPATVAMMEVRNLINGAASSLGFYLLSKEISHKQSYLSQLEAIEKQMAVAEKKIKERDNADVIKQWSEIESDVKSLINYRSKMIELAENSTKNFAALTFAGQQLNPISMEILQAATGMLEIEAGEKLNPQRKKLLIDISDLRYSWANVMSNIRLYLNLGEDGVLENVKTFTEQTRKLIQKIKKYGSALTFEQDEYINQVEERFNTFTGQLDELVAIYTGDKARVDAYIIRTEIGPLMERIQGNLDTLVDQQQKEMTRTGSGVVSQVQTGSGFAILMLIAGFIVAGLVIWALDRFTVNPLKKAVLAMEDVAKGDGDLTKRLRDQGDDEIAQLAKNFNGFVEKIQNLIQQSIGHTEQLASRVDRLKVVSLEASRMADEQQTSTEATVSAVTEMSSTVREVANNTNAAALAADHANKETANGLNVVQQTMDVINQMAQEVESAADAIIQLSKHSEAIGAVLDVIRGIADQTNLLALNAAIEAARAGEQGRGFAVVADEVRTLAARTQTSTQEIQEMIANLQNGSRVAADAMEKGRAQARLGVGQVAQAGTSLQTIAQAVQTIHSMNTQIATSTDQQAKVVEGINKNVAVLHNIAETNAAGAQQTASASNELAELHQQLQSLMAQFKTETEQHKRG